MACATLKRSLDWETINQRPTKRRRCNPYGGTAGGSSSATSTSQPGSPSAQNIANRVQDSEPSPFGESSLARMSPDKMAQNIREEIKMLHRRKQLPFSATAYERMQDSESSGSEMGADSPRRPDTPPSIVSPEKALFTFKQVQMICQRMIKEREDALREKYDSVLSTKLAEQYDAFVKFTYDQIQRRYETAPSYLS